MRSKAEVLEWEQAALPLTSLSEKRAAYQLLSDALFELEPERRDAKLGALVENLQPFEFETHPSLTIMNEADLHQAAATGAMIFANHSWSHPNLASQSDDDQRREIELAKSWLDHSSLPTLPWFAFPRGQYNAKTVEQVAQFCPMMFGMYPKERNAHVLPRVAINRMDQNLMRFRLKTILDGGLLGNVIQPLRAAVRTL